MRLRIFVGTVILAAGLAIYAAAVVEFARKLLPDRVLFEIPFYAVAGLAWIVPAASLTRWMQRAAPYHPPPGAS